LSVHHHESSTAHTAIHTGSADCLLASSQHDLYDIYHCCVYSAGQRNCPKHLYFCSKNKYEKLVHLVGFIIRTVSVNLICCLLYWKSLTFECMLRVILRTSPFQLTFEILCLMIFLFFIYPFYFSDSCIKTFCKIFHSFFQVHRLI
jgi:hypothetical protein